MNIIVVNPEAKQLRENPQLKDVIRAEFADKATIIDSNGTSVLFRDLDRISRRHDINSIFVVGGDGVFNLVLNWLIERKPRKPPRIMSVGGGEFCFMAHYHGLKSTNPLHNLRDIFGGEIAVEMKEWSPVKLKLESSDRPRYGALVSNGIVSDTLEWYEELGKGSLITVLRIVVVACLSVFIDWFRRRAGKLKRMPVDVLMIGNETIHTDTILGIAVSTVNRFVTTMRPFRGSLGEHQLFTVSSWGSFRGLACGLPWVWRGRTPFWLRNTFKNKRAGQVRIKTTDHRFCIDGELVRLTTGSLPREYLLTKGPTVQLLNVVRDH